MDGWQSIAGQLAQSGLPALGNLFGGPSAEFCLKTAKLA